MYACRYTYIHRSNKIILMIVVFVLLFHFLVCFLLMFVCCCEMGFCLFGWFFHRRGGGVGIRFRTHYLLSDKFSGMQISWWEYRPKADKDMTLYSGVSSSWCTTFHRYGPNYILTSDFLTSYMLYFTITVLEPTLFVVLIRERSYLLEGRH